MQARYVIGETLVDTTWRSAVFLPGNHHEAGGRKTLTGDVGVWILAKRIVQDRVADLVAQLIRMAFRYGLGGEEVIDRIRN